MCDTGRGRHMFNRNQQHRAPPAAAGFHVYRGVSANRLLRIASNQPSALTFTDTGLGAKTVLPPDPLFDHVNSYWRWEVLPETAANIHGVDSVGNSALTFVTGKYV